MVSIRDTSTGIHFACAAFAAAVSDAKFCGALPILRVIICVTLHLGGNTGRDGLARFDALDEQSGGRSTTIWYVHRCHWHLSWHNDRLMKKSLMGEPLSFVLQ